MKISYNWLKQFIKLDWEAPKTGELLTDLGLEVEGIANFESIKGSLAGVVVGEVLSCAPHPNADKLKLTTVSIGNGEPVQIVCGAPNVAQGQKVPVATIGTTLYTPEGEAWTIKKGKIRGEASFGMICAEDELGLGNGHDGIMVLSEELQAGTPCSEIFEIEKDEVFEIGLTPNRSDAMSHYGVARDLRAGLLQQEIRTELITPPVSNFNVDNRSLKIDVDVLDSQLAPRYCGISISNLIVQPSPSWLKNRLKAIGLTPKNNVVDATNYVLHELGQPLHAFDTAKIKGHKIEVKTLPAGTKFTTLDGLERELHAEDLMICDVDKPLCIAGVLGGLDSGVTENTTSIFLESAFFDPISIRKSAKRHGINTDASFRFERGVDINLAEYALKRAALLITEIAGGTLTSDIVDLYPKKKQDHEVFLTFDKINSLIGQEIPKDTVKSILMALDIKVKNVSESGLGLAIPFYRVDVRREVDVIEEILRVYGYNNIEAKDKLHASIAPTSKFEDYKLQNVTGSLLASQGFFEIMTNSLTGPANHDHLPGAADTAIELINPLSKELSVMRQSLLFTGLEAVAYNLNRQRSNIKFFEFGNTYSQTNGERQESKSLVLFLSGNTQAESWATPNRPTDFFLLKATVSQILERLGITSYTTAASESPLLSEGLGINSSKGNLLVTFGLVKKSITKAYDIKQPVLFANFEWDTLLALAKDQKIKFTDIPKYPAVKRDLALLLDDAVTYGQIEELAFATERKLLKNVSLFDVYVGDKLPKGKKSYAVSFTLQNDKNTLTDKQIEKTMDKLQQRYERELGAELR